jgi:hypothetical protein
MQTAQHEDRNFSCESGDLLPLCIFASIAAWEAEMLLKSVLMTDE